MRAIERDSRRGDSRNRAYERTLEKQALLDAAAVAASAYQETLQLLTAAHRVTFQPTDWPSIASQPLTSAPLPKTDHEDAARGRLESYSPTWLDRTFGRSKRRKRELMADVTRARSEDAKAHEDELARWREARERVDLAERVLRIEPAAISEVLGQTALANLPFSVEGLEVSVAEDGQRLVVWIDGLDIEDLPTQSVSLLQSGKASIRELSKARRCEIHRDNLCSTALRVAIETLQAAPVPRVEIVVETDLLDPATGHLKPEPVLYLMVARQALETLRLDRVEPFAAVERLGATLAWTARDGFSALDLEEFGLPPRGE